MENYNYNYTSQESQDLESFDNEQRELLRQQKSMTVIAEDSASLEEGSYFNQNQRFKEIQKSTQASKECT